jgi:hypothetical protein
MFQICSAVSIVSSDPYLTISLRTRDEYLRVIELKKSRRFISLPALNFAFCGISS